MSRYDYGGAAVRSNEAGNVKSSENKLESGARLSWGYEGAVAALLYLLFTEWLHPLLEMSDITELYMVKPFLIAFGFFIAIDFLRIPVGIGWLLKGAGCFLLTGWLFHPELFGPAWFSKYSALASQDLQSVLEGRPEWIGPENRTMLFLAGWSVLLHVVYATVVTKRSAAWFAGLTIFYLCLLQLWPGIDTTIGMIRAFAYGTALSVVLRFPRLLLTHGQNAATGGLAASPGNRFGWAISAGLLSLLLAGIGMYGAQHEQGPAQPLEWSTVSSMLQRWTGAEGAQAASTGYGSDDSALGGALKQNPGIAFVAKSPYRTYWRGEAKDVYDGKGWSALRYGEPAVSFDAGGAPIADSPQDQALITQEITLIDEALGKQLFAGGSIVRLDSLHAVDGSPMSQQSVFWDDALSRYTVRSDQKLSAYRIQVAAPPARIAGQGNAALLANGEEAAVALSTASLTDSERYLQLPANIPARVRELAREITAGVGDDPLMKASAIEAYLRSHYTYRLEAGNIPKDGQDFVDQFLFETLEGYCDHFSTSMAVLLRASGIPSRWVKGFAPGELKDGTDDTYIVRHLHAHSWVEAYIPGRGWLQFEPTPAYSAGAAAVHSAEQAAAIVTSGQEADAMKEGADQATKKGSAANGFFFEAAGQLYQQMKTAIQQLLASAAGWVKGWQLNASHMLAAAASALGILIVGGFGWYAFRLFTLWRHNRRLGKLDRAMLLYELLLMRIIRKFGPRGPALTLREYASSIGIEDEERRQAFFDFVRQYEKARYGPSGAGRLSGKRLNDLKERIFRTR
ncbi:transglutaminase domain-containing protein [Paenibacillus turpanensis]|uniref:transglutaminase family protein n=1 Tax=Paenibacillus turpanensis TaxID=2689078 RepID=UPI00140DA563|nr:transglutaminase domain-containing protein [Paenibacillus turpanensis]